MELTFEQAKSKMTENGGSLDLSETGITALPEGLTVGGWLVRPEHERKAMLRKVAEAALASPDALKMSQLHTCETTHCIAGWAQHFGPDEMKVSNNYEAVGLCLLGPVAAQHFHDDDFTAQKYLQSVLDEAA